MRPVPRIAPLQSPSVLAATGASWATGVPRLVMTMGCPLWRTSSSRRRQVCLNSPAGTVFML